MSALDNPADRLGLVLESIDDAIKGGLPAESLVARTHKAISEIAERHHIYISFENLELCWQCDCAWPCPDIKTLWEWAK